MKFFIVFIEDDQINVLRVFNGKEMANIILRYRNTLLVLYRGIKVTFNYILSSENANNSIQFAILNVDIDMKKYLKRKKNAFSPLELKLSDYNSLEELASMIIKNDKKRILPENYICKNIENSTLGSLHLRKYDIKIVPIKYQIIYGFSDKPETALEILDKLEILYPFKRTCLRNFDLECVLEKHIDEECVINKFIISYFNFEMFDKCDKAIYLFDIPNGMANLDAIFNPEIGPKDRLLIYLSNNSKPRIFNNPFANNGKRLYITKLYKGDKCYDKCDPIDTSSIGNDISLYEFIIS